MSSAPRAPRRLLTINTGSSSLKAALYHLAATERRDLAIQFARIGHPGGRFQITDAGGASVLDTAHDLADHAAALRALFAWLRDHRDQYSVAAVGHRVVHGGPLFRKPARVTAELIGALRQLTTIDPDHMLQALGAIEAVRRTLSAVPQVACFDTAFHRHMPRVAQRYALPRQYEDAGIIRYGFHGLSYEFIMQALRAEDRAAAEGRLIIAHLGNGASMVAIRGGVSIDTTMGFTPTGGLVMETRSGDLDPGVPLSVLRAQGLTPDELSALLNRGSGPLAVSGSSVDMREFLDRAGRSARRRGDRPLLLPSEDVPRRARRRARRTGHADLHGGSGRTPPPSARWSAPGWTSSAPTSIPVAMRRTRPSSPRRLVPSSSA